ncbi:hypothetical protein D3C75_797820 [compost metagenome]
MRLIGVIIANVLAVFTDDVHQINLRIQNKQRTKQILLNVIRILIVGEAILRVHIQELLDLIVGQDGIASLFIILQIQIRLIRRTSDNLGNGLL